MSSKNVAEAFDAMDYGVAPESDTHATEWLDSHDNKFSLFINGKLSTPKSAKYFSVKNPANGQSLAKCVQGTKKDVDDAVKAARSAQKKWAALPGFERARYLYAIARLIQKHARLFAVLESLDNGKTIRETRDIDIPLVARHFYHHAGWAQRMETDFPDYEAYGVAGQIIPWNFPLLMLAWKIAPAIALGNTAVLKPAEQTPLTALLFAEICMEAGLPAGVINIVTGDGKTGAQIVDHNNIDKLAFTGSTEIGRLIRKNSAGTGKGLTLELGGKSPIIVFEDADLDAAVEGVVDAIWFNQGEVCCGGSRLLVQEGVYERFIDKLTSRMEKLRTGDPLDKSIDIGAVVDGTQQKRIADMVKRAVKDGATLHQPTEACPKKGCFYPPTLLTDVEPSDYIMQEEVFGPVIGAMSFRNQDEAEQIANNTRYGLAASIWTDNINMALEMAPRLKCGVVWVNSTNMFDAAVGFGGYRESGYGREGGVEGLYAYMKPKYETTLKPLPARNKRKENLKKIAATSIDRTAKLYIGGKQARPDGNYSLPIMDHDGNLISHVGEGNRKDIRNAVEAARKADGWSSKTNAHLRAQIMYYMGENLSTRADEFTARLRAMTGCSDAKAKQEVDMSVQRLFSYAGWCDKYEGTVHAPPFKGVALAMKEAVGIIGIACPDQNPLLSFISLIAPSMAMGNRCVVLPSELHPLAATDFYQVLDTSDVPAGVINIVTGKTDELSKTLSEHDNVDAMWYFGPQAGCKMVEENSIGNLKQTWVSHKMRDWTDIKQGEGIDFLRRATQVKNIWVPYGE